MKPVSGILLLAAIATFFMTISTPAAAQTEISREQLMERFQASGANKVGFLGHAYGLDGWIIINKEGNVKYIYTTKEGAMLEGMLYAPNGRPETLNQLKAYHDRISGGQAAAPGGEKSIMLSEQLYTAAEKSNWVALGNPDAPYLYVFLNTNCGHCRDFWLDIAPFVDNGQFQIRVIPYGEAPANRDGGAALLAAKDPLSAWKAHVNGDTTALAKDKATDKSYTRLDANTALIKKWKIPQPPFTIYRRPADGVIAVISGRPENKLLLPAEFLK